VAREYLICKYGLYYAPNSERYTGIRVKAGRNTLAEAEDRSHPNGKEGSRDGINYMHESVAPEFSPKCHDDLKAKHLMEQRDALSARLAEVEAERKNLRSKVAALVLSGGFAEAENAKLREFFDAVEAFSKNPRPSPTIEMVKRLNRARAALQEKQP